MVNVATLVPNIFLIFVAVIAPFIVIACSFVFLIYFSSPDDKFQAWIPKIIVILGFTLSALSVLLLPFDVYNIMRDALLGPAIQYVWQILYSIIAIFVVIIIPFSIFYYEAQDPSVDWKKSILIQIKWGLIASFVITFITIVVVAATYWFLGKAEIPYNAYASPLKTVSGPSEAMDNGLYTYRYAILTIRVSPVLYLIAVISLIGWIFFIVFGGCGMTALPMGLILSFFFRPKRIDLKTYAEVKIRLRERSEQLINIGKDIQDRQRSGKGGVKTRRIYNVFKQAVFNLENDYQRLETGYKDGGGSPILHLIKLILGLASSVISVLWMVHIVLYLCFPWALFACLNYAFYYLDKYVYVLGIILYTIFTFYLLFAVLAGNIKVGERLLFFSVHPMKYKDTVMSSFLFNVGLLLLCTVSITQFSAYAFSGYCAGTAVGAMFSTFIRHMIFFKYFFIFYPHAFVAFSAVGFVLCLLCAKKPDRDKKLQKEIAQM